MRVAMLLADHAVVAGGKLYVNGGGWSIRTPDPLLTYIALKLEVPWDLAGRPLGIALRLVDEDGHPVVVGQDPLTLTAQLTVERPAGLVPGAAMDALLAFRVPPFALQPSSRFSWRLSINDEEHADWVLPFATAPSDAR